MTAPGEYVKRVGRLVAIEDVTPPAPAKVLDYIFEQVTARCELRFRGEVIQRLQTLNDHYGEGTAVVTAVKEMREYAANKQIEPDCDLEVVVVRIAEHYRMRPTQNARDPYRTIEYGCQLGMPDAVETIVWSSKNPEWVSDYSKPKPKGISDDR